MKWTREQRVRASQYLLCVIQEEVDRMLGELDERYGPLEEADIRFFAALAKAEEFGTLRAALVLPEYRFREYLNIARDMTAGQN